MPKALHAEADAGALGPQIRGQALCPPPRSAACPRHGFSEHYTPAQIRASIERAKLPNFHIDFGYAAFLPEDSFKAVAKPSNRQDYDSLRRLMAAFKSSREPSWDEGSGGHPPPGVAS
jgi:hypothetical protein